MRRGDLLRFATGSSRAPLDGFDPPLTIVDGGPLGPSGGLPRSHTCFNQLVVPRFGSFDDLAAAFDTALEHGNEGFFLS